MHRQLKKVMRNYWKCESAEDAAAKVAVVCEPGVYGFNEYHYYFGFLDDAVEQYKRWYNGVSVNCGSWKSVKLYVKNGSKWKEYKDTLVRRIDSKN